MVLGRAYFWKIGACGGLITNDNDNEDDDNNHNTICNTANDNEHDESEGSMQGHPRLATNVEGWPVPVIVKKATSRGVALDPLIFIVF